jgi:pyruvate ferredoxin oxidoreductase beta subunit
MDIPEEEYINKGHRACAGCAMALIYRYALKGLGPKTIVTIPASCLTVLQGMQGFCSVKVPIIHTCFETTAASASGISASLKQQGKDKEITVVAFAGDGGTVDIGIQGLSGAAERRDDFIYCCYDNEAYMNTGTQRSGSSPWGAITTTTPIKGKKQHKKNFIMIMEAHALSYVASISPSHPTDIIAKFQAAKERHGQGVRYIHAISPCPPGWGHNSNQSIQVAKLAVETGFWPLYEIIDGTLILSKPSKHLVNPKYRKPISEYLKIQKRFRKLTDEDIKEWQNYVDDLWEEIQKRI